MDRVMRRMDLRVQDRPNMAINILSRGTQLIDLLSTRVIPPSMLKVERGRVRS